MSFNCSEFRSFLVMYTQYHQIQRVAFFSWTTTSGKILTIENLWYKGVTVIDWCYMCKKSGESVNHLLLHCPIAYELWSMVWALFGLQWVMPHGVSDLFSSQQGSFGGHRNIDLWRAVPHCVLQCIWRERNSRCLKGEGTDYCRI